MLPLGLAKLGLPCKVIWTYRYNEPLCGAISAWGSMESWLECEARIGVGLGRYAS